MGGRFVIDAVGNGSSPPQATSHDPANSTINAERHRCPWLKHLMPGLLFSSEHHLDPALTRRRTSSSRALISLATFIVFAIFSMAASFA